MPVYANKGFQQITSAGVAPLTIPGGANRVLIQAEAQNWRWRDDGTDPTATVGMLLVAGDTMFYEGDLTKFKAIPAAAGAILNITYVG